MLTFLRKNSNRGNSHVNFQTWRRLIERWGFNTHKTQRLLKTNEIWGGFAFSIAILLKTMQLNGLSKGLPRGYQRAFSGSSGLTIVGGGGCEKKNHSEFQNRKSETQVPRSVFPLPATGFNPRSRHPLQSFRNALG